MKKRILLVEDDIICSTLEKKLFEAADCEVVVAKSGEAALELFAESIVKKSPFDAVSMDIGLPGKNGIETCESIRQYETEHSLRSIPIVAVTSNADPDIVQKCLSAGMASVMPKPIQHRELTSRYKIVAQLSY